MAGALSAPRGRALAATLPGGCWASTRSSWLDEGRTAAGGRPRWGPLTALMDAAVGLVGEGRRHRGGRRDRRPAPAAARRAGAAPSWRRALLAASLSARPASGGGRPRPAAALPTRPHGPRRAPGRREHASGDAATAAAAAAVVALPAPAPAPAAGRAGRGDRPLARLPGRPLPSDVPRAWRWGSPSAGPLWPWPAVLSGRGARTAPGWRAAPRSGSRAPPRSDQVPRLQAHPRARSGRSRSWLPVRTAARPLRRHHARRPGAAARGLPGAPTTSRPTPRRSARPTSPPTTRVDRARLARAARAARRAARPARLLHRHLLRAGALLPAAQRRAHRRDPRRDRRAGAHRELERGLLLTSLLEAADRVDSTCGLQMAYLKQWAPRALNAARAARAGARSPARRATVARATPTRWPDARRRRPAPTSTRRTTSTPTSRNYHVWETLVRWDAPDALRRRLQARRLPDDAERLQPRAATRGRRSQALDRARCPRRGSSLSCQRRGLPRRSATSRRCSPARGHVPRGGDRLQALRRRPDRHLQPAPASASARSRTCATPSACSSRGPTARPWTPPSAARRPRRSAPRGRRSGSVVLVHAR